MHASGIKRNEYCRARIVTKLCDGVDFPEVGLRLDRYMAQNPGLSLRSILKALLLGLSVAGLHCVCGEQATQPTSGVVVPKRVEHAMFCDTYASVACGWYLRCFPEGLEAYRPNPSHPRKAKRTSSEPATEPKIDLVELCRTQLSSPCDEVLSFYKVEEKVTSGELSFSPEDASKWLKGLNQRGCEDDELSIAPESIFQTRAD